MNSQTTEIEYIGVDKLQPSPWNPSSRTEEKSMKELISSMERYGFWKHMPIVLGRDNGSRNTIIDGHRRWTAAKTLGIKEVPCLRTELDPQLAWAETMGAARKITDKELFQAYLRGLRVFPDNSTGKRFQYYLSKYGDGLITKIARAGKSGSSISQAEGVCRFVGWEYDHVPEVIEWINKHSLRNKINIIIQTNEMSPEQMRRKISSNKTISFK